MGNVVNLQQPEKKLDPRCAAEMLMANALYELGKLGFNKMAVLRIVSGFVDNVLIDDQKWKECAEDLWNCRHLLSAKKSISYSSFAITAIFHRPDSSCGSMTSYGA